jgi:Immunity protein 32
MFSVELMKPTTNRVADVVEVYLDAEGLDSLLAQLRFLTEGRTDHVHFMSTSWGGTHLDDQPQNPNSTTIHHVKILLRPDTKNKKQEEKSGSNTE